MTDVVLPTAAGADTGIRSSADGAPTTSRRGLTPIRTALLFAVAYLPFIGLGYGTDIDITNIMRSGESLFDGRYRYSRPPGALPYEALVGALAPLGGPLLVNLCSVIAATAVLVLLAGIVAEDFGDRPARMAVVIVGAQPWFWVAATSLGDYVFALAFLLAGIRAARHDHRIVAGLCFAVGIGFRSGTVLLIASYLLAELLASADEVPGSTAGSRWRAVTITCAAMAVGVTALFLPSWLSAGKTSRFLINEFETTGLPTMIGRWGIKNAAFFGLVTIAVLLIRLPVLAAAVRRFPSQTLVRFAVLAAVAAELLFLRFPWKPVHLLPTILGLAILVAASPKATTRFVGTLVASQILLAVVGITIAEPDVADRATTGHLHVGLTRGVVLNDLDCRLEPPYEGDWPELDGPAADYAAIDVFTCQARSWRADTD